MIFSLGFVAEYFLCGIQSGEECETRARARALRDGREGGGEERKRWGI